MESNKKPKPKEKRRSNEKRKEKSRDAARCRRSRETDIFTDLAAALPIPQDQAAHLDKASVMRLAIAYCKVRRVVKKRDQERGAQKKRTSKAKEEPTPEMDESFLKALDGFMLVLSNDGDMVYLSENVSEYLGVSQMDMMGQSVYEYSHPCDHEELRECLSQKVPKGGGDKRRPSNFFLRLKCTLTSKGRKVNLKSASYKVIHCTGHLMPIACDNSSFNDSKTEDEEDRDERDAEACLVVVGCPIPHPSNIEVPLGRHTFLSKHSLNMKFTYADDKLAEFLGWNSNELVGQSVFDFHHALDNPALDKSFKSLFSKGQCETAEYRFLGKKGGYAWVVTQATLIHCSKQHKPLSVVCVNYILSGIECQDEVYSSRQLEARCSVKLEEPASSCELAATKIPPVQTVQIPVVVPETRARPLAVTASLFRTQEKPRKELPTQAKLTGSRKDVLARPAGGVEEKARKENEIRDHPRRQEPRIGSPACSPLAPAVSPLQKPVADELSQGKPILDYHSEQYRNRPQAVTRSLFAPAPPHEQTSRPPPQTATASIFAPRTKEMNKGFLTFSEDQPGLTMLKDEPEDLTHLAPTAGDVCVPLEDTPFLNDMLDEFILDNENYCPLLSPDLPVELRGSELGESLKDPDVVDSLRSGTDLAESLAESDPFMYRDSPSPCSASPNLLSPVLGKSPERSLDSLCSPNASSGSCGDGGGGLSEDEILMQSIRDVLADDELALRAPYIPMSDQDEVLQQFISNDMVMWSPSQPPDKKSKWIEKEPEQEQPNLNSSLAQLLSTDVVTRKCQDHGGGLLVDRSESRLGRACGKRDVTEEAWNVKKERLCGGRPHKRVHTPTASFLSENKRIKCEETNSRQYDLKRGDGHCRSICGGGDDDDNNDDDDDDNDDVDGDDDDDDDVDGDDDDSAVDAATVISSQQGSQLLQQLMSQQTPKTRQPGPRDGGGTGSPTPPRQQSNSVLMNLLVSGCDDLVDPRGLSTLLQQKLSPLSVNLDNQTVPQCPANLALDHLSPDTRKQLVNSLPMSKPIDSPNVSTTMSFDNFEFDIGSMNSGLLHGSDLLRALDSNLV